MRLLKNLFAVFAAGTILTVSALAASTTLSSYYTEKTVELDGTPDSDVYILSGEFPETDSRIGVSFDSEYIYLSAVLSEEYDRLEFKIAGKELTYNISEGVFGEALDSSSGVGTDDGIELKLAYSDLGIGFVPTTRAVDFGASLVGADKRVTLDETKLELLYLDLFTFDNCDSFANAGYAEKESMVNKDQMFIGQSESTESAYSFHNLSTTESIRNIVRTLNGYTVGDAFFEFDLKVNDLPVMKDKSLCGWYGFVFEIQNTVRRRFALSADENDNIILSVLYNTSANKLGVPKNMNLGKKLGDTIKLRMYADKEHSFDVYVDGVFVDTFERIDYACSYTRDYFVLTGAYYNVASGALDVELLDYAFAFPKDALESLTLNSVKGKNESANSVVANLSLCETVEINGTSYSVVWSSSDTKIISDDGVPVLVTENAGKKATMTASVSIGGEILTKTFEFKLSNDLAAPILAAYFESSKITCDGNISESVVLRNLSLPESDITAGVVWTTDGIAVGIDTGSVSASDIILSLNDNVFNFDISSSNFAENVVGVSGAVGDGEVELFLDYSSVGIEFSAGERVIPFGLSVSDGKNLYTAREKFILTTTAEVSSADNCDDFNSQGYGKYSVLGDAKNLTMTQNGSSYAYKYNGSSTFISGFGRNFGITTAPYELELNITARDLPVVPANTAWRGVSLDFSDVIRGRFGITADTDGQILFSALYEGGDSGISKTLETGVYLGDTFSLRISADENYAITLYIDGRNVGSLPAIDFRSQYTHAYLEVDISNYDKASGGVDVEIYDISVSRKLKLLESLTFADIKGNNISSDAVFTDLELVDSVELDDTGIVLPITWKSSNEEYVGSDGRLTYSEDSIGKTVTMTATAVSGGVSLKKDIQFTLNFETVDEDLYFIFGDKNPYTGALKSTNVNFLFPFDSEENSVGLDLGEICEINTVELIDLDGVSKMHRNDVSLYVSDDNVSYTRIKDFDLFRTENKYIFANFTANARYVKVHCHISVNEFVSFKNNLADILRASDNDGLVANGGGSFEKIGKISLKSTRDNTDGTAFVAFADMGIGIDEADLTADKRDLRFVYGTRVLRHYVEGDGAYIRMPDADKDKVFALDIYGKNDSAENISDSGSVFEIIYGNRTVSDITDPENGFNHCVTTARCPNGDIIAIATEGIVKFNMTMRRSTDGGRTWGETTPFWNNGRHADGCGFLVDGDRMYCFFHIYPIPPTSYYTLKVAILMSDDNGYTWKNPDTGEVNSPYFPAEDKYYSVTYCEGIKLSTFDGEGDGVDYLFVYTIMEEESSQLFASVIYTKDGGKTWQSSESKITYEADSDEAGMHESGVSEAGVVELSDGTLEIYCRVQYSDNILFGKTRSYDHGITWEENCTLTEIYTSNTHPVLKKYNDSILLLWGGNNMMGGRSYFRAPINLAYSKDDMKTWNAKHDILSGTSEGNIRLGSYMCVQPKMIFDDYKGGDNMHIAWWKWRTDSAITMLVEDADDYIHKTKGAADSFESTSALYEGWSTIEGSVSISDEQATDGTHSMKIVDTTGKVVRASRSVTEMYSGEISYDIYFEKYSSWFYCELKTALSFDHYVGNLLAFCVSKDGTVYAVNSKNETNTKTDAVLETGKWYNLKVKFDINEGVAELYVDNTKVADLPVNDSYYGGINIVQLADASATLPAGLTAYIDNFRAYEGTTFELFEEAPEKEVTVKVKLSREEGSKPYDTEGCSSIATLNIYTDSTKATLLKSEALESTETATSEISLTFTLSEGEYYAEIIKNGYLTFEKDFTVGKDDEALGDITLIPGDLKDSYEAECGDGIVDVDDFVRILRGFSAEEDEYKIIADINEDGSVNVSDLGLVKSGFGKTSKAYGEQ